MVLSGPMYDYQNTGKQDRLGISYCRNIYPPVHQFSDLLAIIQQMRDPKIPKVVGGSKLR